MTSISSTPTGFERGDVIPVHQGEFQVSSDQQTTFSTVLGSCVAACVRDTIAGVGGMNHFLLAEQSSAARGKFGASARYGAFAMEQLINRILVEGTGDKSNLEVKLFGGGRINTTLADIGAKNIAFVREFLRAEGYAVKSEDMGGSYARRVLFKPASGRAICKRLDSAWGNTIGREELAIARRGPATRPAVEIELF